MRILPADQHSEPVALPQSKSVRISLERLDHMLNAVGELVINRTRMRGRLAELEQLANALNFSRERISQKIVEFQQKSDFGKLSLMLILPQCQMRVSPTTDLFDERTHASAICSQGVYYF